MNPVQQGPALSYAYGFPVLVGGLVSDGMSACPRTICGWAEILEGGVRFYGVIVQGNFPRITADSQ